MSILISTPATPPATTDSSSAQAAASAILHTYSSRAHLELTSFAAALTAIADSTEKGREPALLTA